MADITDIRIYKIEGTGNLKAFATVTLDDAFAVHGLKVMEGDSGLWVSMPASKNKRGEFKDIFHPINKEAREVLVNAVLEAYGKEA
jgi:stage V sporulation protein G